MFVQQHYVCTADDCVNGNNNSNGLCAEIYVSDEQTNGELYIYPLAKLMLYVLDCSSRKCFL